MITLRYTKVKGIKKDNQQVYQLTINTGESEHRIMVNKDDMNMFMTSVARVFRSISVAEQ